MTVNIGSELRRAVRYGRSARRHRCRMEYLEVRDLLTGVPAVAADDSYVFDEDSSNQVAGLIHRWTFDDLSGDVARDSVGKADLYLRGYQPNDVRAVPGRSGGALTFTRDSNYAVSATSVSVTQFSLSFWLQMDAYQGLNPRIATPAGDELLYVNLEHGRGMRFANAAVDPVLPVLGQWEHYVITYNRPTGDATIYKNGNQVSTAKVNLAPINASWVFGHNQDPSNPLGTLVGDLDDFRIYDHALSTAEVAAVYRGSSAVASVLANDTDAENDALSAVLVDGPQHGTVDLRADGYFTYTPAQDFSGTDTFTYQVFDGTSHSNVATATITVTPVNDAPVGLNDSYQFTPGNALTVSAADGALKNDSDVDGPTLTASLVSLPLHGSLTFTSDGAFVYTDDGSSARDQFTYQVSDGTANSGVVTVFLRSPDNAAPQAADESFEVTEDQVFDVDPAANTLSGLIHRWTFDETTGNSAADMIGGKAITLNGYGAADPRWVPGRFGGALKFSKDTNYGLTDAPIAVSTFSVSFWIRTDSYAGINPRIATPQGAELIYLNLGDGRGVSFLGSATDSVRPALATWEQYVVTYDRPSGQSRVYRDGRPVASAKVTLVASNKRWMFGHNQDASNHGDSFKGELDDVRIYNRVLNEREAELLAGGTDAVIGSLLANDTDADGDPLTAVLVDGVKHGALTLSPNGRFAYLPNVDYSGTDSFTYRANDGVADSGLATVTLNVKAMNDPPIAVDHGFQATEDTPLSVSAPDGVLKGASDVDSVAFTAIQVTNPSHGSLELRPDGSFVYSPAKNYFGTDAFTYRISDGLANSPIATVTIAVAGTQDPPVAVADSYQASEDTQLVVPAESGVLKNDSDPDNDPLTAVLVSSVQHGDLVLAPDGSFRYLPTLNYSGTDSFSYRTSDGMAESAAVTVTLAVAAVNDPPTAVNDVYSVATSISIPAAAGVLANDLDIEGTKLTALLVKGPSHGTLSLKSDGSFTYTRGVDFPGSDTFTYQTRDQSAVSQIATVTILSALQIVTQDATIVADPKQSVSGSFDVYLTLASGFAFSASGYEVTLKSPAPESGVTLVSAVAASASHPALFTERTPEFRTIGGNFQITDILASGAAVITDQAVLFRVNYSVAPGTVGAVPLSLVPAFTHLSDEAGLPLPVGQLVSATIYVVRQTIPGDLDNDQDVDAADVVSFLSNWTGSLDPNTGSMDWSNGDFDNDDDVDSSDLLMLMSNWTGDLAAALAGAPVSTSQRTTNRDDELLIIGTGNQPAVTAPTDSDLGAAEVDRAFVGPPLDWSHGDAKDTEKS